MHLLALVALVSAAPDFTREIRPLLSRNCVACHGPDEKHRKGGLRLDLREGAFREKDGTRAFVPGRPDLSEALARMRAKDPDDRMPPAETGKTLTEAEIALVERWIRAGAPWEEHWSFTPPRRPEVPPAAWPDLARGDIDRLVQARLGKEGLRPSPPADPRTLARRVALDLTGLPASPAEVDAFARDPGERAYEALVDRLLASPAYGERWARVWLDLARYADSKGYEKDRPRTMWRWRDWVIDAFNRDLPYPRFTLEQMAGDLLPGATPDQVLATAFHRNTLTNDEGGTDDEEFRVAAVKDRLDTTLQAWMGLTAGCAKCHDHKYDPISSREYYRLYAFFDQTEDADRGDEAPTEAMPTPEQRRALDAAAARVAELETKVARLATARAERALRARLGRASVESVAPAKLGTWRQSPPFGVPAGVAPLAAVFAPEQAPVDPAAWKERDLRDGRVARLGTGAGTVTYLARTVEAPGARLLRLQVTADEGVAIWLDRRLLAHGAGTMVAAAPVGAGKHTLLVKLANGGDDQELLFRVEGEEVGGVPLAVARALLTPERKRSADERRTIREHLARAVDAEAVAALDAARADERALREAIPRIPVLRELPAGKRRESRLHVRGNFLEKGDRVEPGVPAALHAWPAGAPLDRRGLAAWLTDPANPLTARVAVNRVWAQLFGVGLVETEEDFGTQGAPPADRALLDWLATEFVAQGWSHKRLLRTIVLSHTYRQSARVDAALRARDPFNRLLARGLRFRLDAEAVRDATLAAAGLLSSKMYGPSVMPPQPDGIWAAVYSGDRWIVSPGEDRYRRGLYTFVRRTSPYPSMTTFDAPSREVCSIRRIRSNTPLQALVTLNDPVYVEAAQALARRMLREADPPPRQRIAHGFRLALLRPPTEAELAPLVDLHARRERHFRAHPAEARALATQPLGALPDGVDPAEAAALTAVANVILNLDEFLTKG